MTSLSTSGNTLTFVFSDTFHKMILLSSEPDIRNLSSFDHAMSNTFAVWYTNLSITISLVFASQMKTFFLESPLATRFPEFETLITETSER
jgi:hypothetical protein